MSVAVNDLIDKAEIILQDTTNVRWSASELIGWLNDGQRETVLHKPEASVTNTAVQLSTGSKQSLPTGGIILIEITRNMGTNGTTPGNAIRIIDRRILDAQVPDWHLTSGQAAVVKHYVFDDRDPKNYYVYPPSDGTNYIEIIYSSSPTAVSSGGNISIDDIYANALVDFILYRAYSKDADYASNAKRAIGHYQAFLTAIGEKEKAEMLVNPNQSFDQTTIPIG